MKDLFCDASSEVALLVDASNSLNSVKRQAALRNISILCPALSMVLHNTYGVPACLFVIGQGRFLHGRVQLRVISLQFPCIHLQWCS